MLFKNKEFNTLIGKLKNSGFVIEKKEDKQKIIEFFTEAIISEKGLITILEEAFNMSFLKKSSNYEYYLNKKDKFLLEIEKDENYQDFKNKYEDGGDTQVRISSKGLELEKEIFEDLKRDYKQERFYNELFSDSIKFKEIVKYLEYENGDSEYITMHKTKGSGIENVVVVLEEFFWNKYDFSSMFNNETNEEKILKNQKLFYVACSRSIKNLIVVKVIKAKEEENLKKLFDGFEITKVNGIS